MPMQWCVDHMPPPSLSCNPDSPPAGSVSVRIQTCSSVSHPGKQNFPFQIQPHFCVHRTSPQSHSLIHEPSLLCFPSPFLPWSCPGQSLQASILTNPATALLRSSYIRSLLLKHMWPSEVSAENPRRLPDAASSTSVGLECHTVPCSGQLLQLPRSRFPPGLRSLSYTRPVQGSAKGLRTVYMHIWGLPANVSFLLWFSSTTSGHSDSLLSLLVPQTNKSSFCFVWVEGKPCKHRFHSVCAFLSKVASIPFSACFP